jgi:acyl transferase domain-containing protein
LGSVKDNIGHCEAASGVAGVIKVLLMMHHGMIPKQANFVTLNPRITTSPDDRISIPTATQPWVAERIALVNNYGAAGSNAAILLREHSRTQQMVPGATSTTVPATPYPILLSAKSASHLEAYVNKLRVYLSSTDVSLQDVAYNLARRQNLSFKYRVAFIAADTHDLLLALSGAHIPPVPAVRSPVVLVFGGQTGRTVTVSRELYDECDIFRRHLVSL